MYASGKAIYALDGIKLKQDRWEELTGRRGGEIDTESLPLGTKAFMKKSDLYNRILYSVVPKDHNIKQGVFPDDQGFSNRYVYLWSSRRYVPSLLSKDWKTIEIQVESESLIRNHLRVIGNGVYTLPHLSNRMRMEEIDYLQPYEK